MRTIKLTLEYDGSGFSGWQRQKEQASVQETVEDAVRRITGRKTVLHGAGRTDAGVHALGQVAHFKTATQLPADRLRGALNAHLPASVAVRECADEAPDFHARYHATGKRYRYLVYNAPTRPVLERQRAFFVRYRLDIRSMREAAGFLIGRHNFRAFAAAGGGAGSAVRTVRSLAVSRSGPLLRFEVIGDGFLYKMVRSVVGTLLEVGRGRLAPEALAALLAPEGRHRAGPTVPGKGLCLMEVYYA